MKIIIFGSDVNGIKILEENVRRALEELGISASIERKSDFETAYGTLIFKTVGIAIDGRIGLIGQVPTIEGIKNCIITGVKVNE